MFVGGVDADQQCRPLSGQLWRSKYGSEEIVTKDFPQGVIALVGVGWGRWR